VFWIRNYFFGSGSDFSGNFGYGSDLIYQIDNLQIEVRTCSSDPDLKLIIMDPDHANYFGSDRIRFHNTGSGYGTVPYLASAMF